MLASKLASGIEGKEDDDLTELILNRISSCRSWSFTVILAVAAIARADYSAHVIFIPLFVIAGLLVCCMTCIICCIRDLPGDGLEGDVEEGGLMDTSPHHVPTYNTCGTYSSFSIPRGTTGGMRSSDASPFQELTPAPENQADGGID